MTKFTPKIVVFGCNWANIADAPKEKIKPNPRTIKTMCSGRVDPTFILQAFKKGIDGVLIVSCCRGDCHYIRGNLKTQRMVLLLKTMLSQLQIEPERVRLISNPASESQKLQKAVSEFTKKIVSLGPLSAPKKATARGR
jgi:F420-non-reducing hydrogenase iron-sulfur subunit